MSYQKRKLDEAMWSLAGEGELRNRLADAARLLLIGKNGTAKDETETYKPDPVDSDEYLRIIAALTSVPDENRGSLTATLDTLTESEMERLSYDIIELWKKLT